MPQSDDDGLVGNGEESQVHCKSIDDIYSLYECFFGVSLSAFLFWSAQMLMSIATEVSMVQL